VVIGAAIGIWFYERPMSFFNERLALQMHAAGAHSRWVTVGGHRMHYYVEGPSDDPPVVLVHGLGGRSEDWHALTVYARAAGTRIYMPDLLGYGQSERPSDFSYSIPDEAAAVIGFMDAMGLRQVDLGGWSMGGWIAQRIAIDHPERVKRLMLFDSAGIYNRPAWNTNLFTPTSPQELDELDALLMPHPPEVPSFVARDFLRYSRDREWVMHRAMNSMLTGKDVTDSQLPQLKMPVLIVWGAEDRITPLELGEKMHQLVPQSELDVIAGCGHLAPAQCADKVGPKVTEFLH
jgi:pimeloyl-ACP methyl ester carboxylesterase